MRRIACSIVIGFATALSAVPAYAQKAADLVGSWTFVLTESTAVDGKVTLPFGEKPIGTAMFTAEGRYVYVFLNSTIPAFASGNRTTGTAEENAAVVKGSLVSFGTYQLVGDELVLKVEGSTYPNWRGVEQKRTIKVLNADELVFTNAAGSSGGVTRTVMTRIK